jgi:hypothetical protein
MAIDPVTIPRDEIAASGFLKAVKRRGKSICASINRFKDACLRPCMQRTISAT